MAIAVFVSEHPRVSAQYRWAALTPAGIGPMQFGLAGVPPGADAVLIAPASAVRLTAARLPARNRRKLTQLAYVIEDELAADAATLHAVVGTALADGQHAIAVCERDWIAGALATVKDAGLVPVSMRFETCLPLLPTGAWIAIWNGLGGFVRTGAMSGLAYDAEPAGGAPLALRLAIGETRFPPKQIQLRATPGAAPPDVAAWSQALGVPVLEAAPWPGLDAGWDKSLEMLTGEFAPRGRLGRLREVARAMRPAALVLALIVVVQFLFTFGEWMMLKGEQSRLHEQMVKDFRAAFPEAQQIVDPGLQMQRNLADLRGAAGVADDADFLTLAARAAPALQGTRINLIRYDKGRLDVDTVYASPQALDNARRMLGSAMVKSGDAAPGGGINAHILLGPGAAS
jgi:general secretion pathway protein L